MATHIQKSNTRWYSLLIVSSAIFLAVIDLFIVNVAIPSIKEGIQGSDGDIQLVIVLYVIGYAAFLILGGRAGDYFGKKKVFIGGILVFTLASAICGFSQNPLQLNAGRLVQGISAAFMVPQGVAFIPVLYPDLRQRAKALSIYGSIAGVASVIGQFLGGVLPDIYFVIDGWRLIFLINLPLGVLAAVMAYLHLENDAISAIIPQSNEKTSGLRANIPSAEKSPARRIDFNFSGVILLALALIALLYPMIVGRELAWPWWSICMLLSSAPLIILFLVDQRRRLAIGKEPLLRFEVFRNTYFAIGLCAAVFYYMVQDSYFLINAIHLQDGLGVSSSLSGLYFACQGIGYVIASVLSVKPATRFGKQALIIGLALMIGGLSLHLLVLQESAIMAYKIAPVLFLYGLGCGTVLPTMFTLAIKNVPPSMVGAASGIYLTFQQIAIALGIGIIGGIFFHQIDIDTSVKSYYEAYHIATSVNIFLLFLVAIIYLFLPQKESSEPLSTP